MASPTDFIAQYDNPHCSASCRTLLHQTLIRVHKDLAGRVCADCRHFSDEILIPLDQGEGLCYSERNLENPVFADMSCRDWEPHSPK